MIFNRLNINVAVELQVFLDLLEMMVQVKEMKQEVRKVVVVKWDLKKKKCKSKNWSSNGPMGKKTVKEILE